MNYIEAQEYLKSIQELGAKLTLDNISSIIKNLPFDISGIKFIQVGGTNGKGSTSHCITSILQHAGYKAGLFTSPHLQDIRERITINKEWISEKDFADSLTEIKHIVTDMEKAGTIENIPTFFEHIFLTSLHYFHKKGADFAVLEVGLGGRLDATSTIVPAANVITNVSLEHTKTLGPRISDISREKAGIIKKSVPVICGCNKHSVSTGIIRQTAKELDAPFLMVNNSRNRLSYEVTEEGYSCNYNTDYGEEYDYEVTLNGPHQTQNAAAAIRVIEALNKYSGIKIDKKAICEGIKNNFIPGRIEHIKTSKGSVLLDGGHNLACAKVLKDFLEQKKLKDLTLVFGVLRDKKFNKMVELLSPFIKRVIITEPVSKRKLEAESLIPLFADKPTVIRRELRDAYEEAMKHSETTLITGSLYLAGEMRNIILEG